MVEGGEGLVRTDSPDNPLVALWDDFFFKSVFNLAMISRFGHLGLFLMARPPSSQDKDGVK